MDVQDQQGHRTWSSHDEEYSAESGVSFDEGGYPPMAPTEGNRALLARLNAVNRDMGLPEMGELDPETIVTPSIFVQRVVRVAPLLKKAA